jgi:hypothetical protein
MAYSILLGRLALCACVVASFSISATGFKAAQQTPQTVVIYGATGGGFGAAISAAREQAEGGHVVLISLSNHVGGMVTGGLQVSDCGCGGCGAFTAQGKNERKGKRRGQAVSSEVCHDFGLSLSPQHTDSANATILGGITREFFERVERQVSQKEEKETVPNVFLYFYVVTFSLPSLFLFLPFHRSR